MRITIILLLFSVMYVQAESGYSQETKLSLNMKSTSIKDACLKIEKNTEFVFIFSDNTENAINKKVNISANHKDIYQVLEDMLIGTNLNYKILDKQIVVFKDKDKSRFLTSINSIEEELVQQNTKTITGIIVDENGESIIAANVLESGTTNGTITDIDGSFTFRVAEDAIIRVSYIGYLGQDVNTKGRNTFNITLKEDSHALEEVVVVGYGSMRKKDLTGGLSVVDKDKLEMVSTNNLIDRLIGQVAGFNITTTNAAPGSNQNLLIRGENSLSASNSPLIILDGIPYDGSLADFDPNIIDNISVLKDASSAAIYGSRGSNGVILIQTKKGAKGKPQVVYKGKIGLAEPMQRIQAMKPNEYIRFKQDIGRLKYGYEGDQLDPIAGQVISASERVNYLSGEVHDWQDYVFQTAFNMEHQLSISGGSDFTTYMAAASHSNQEGVVYNSNLIRNNISFNINQVFNDWLTIGIGTHFIHKETGGITPNIEHAIKQSPYGIHIDEQGYYYQEPMDYSLIINPMANVNADQDNTSRNFFNSVYTDMILPIKGLSFRSNFGYNYRNNSTGTYYGMDTVDGKKVNGKASIYNTNYTDYTWENLLRYEHVYNEHKLDATGLFSIQETKSVTSSLSGESFVNDDSSYFNLNGAEKNLTNTSGLTETSMLSYMLRLNYSYNSKYLATLTGRTDGSSVFGRNNKYAFFPSIALAWHIAEEEFIKDNIDWIDMFKMRLSYGSNGNQAISPYRTFDRLYSIKYIWGDGSTPVNATYLPNDGIGNPNLKWETTNTANLGLDFQLLRGRLNGTIDMYLSNTHDLLMVRTVPIMNGYNKIYDNIGQTRNRGIEVNLNSYNIKNKNFTWNTEVNFSLNRDEIIELRGDQIDDISNKWFIGKPLRVYYDYNVVGIWQKEDLFTHTDLSGNETVIQQGATPGAAKIEDFDGNGHIDANDRKIIASKMPDFRLSMGNRLSYKNFNMSVLLNGVFGVGREDNVANISTWTFGITNYVHGANYWTPENTNADIVSPSYTNFEGHSYYKKLNYLQLKNITFGYMLNSNIVKGLGLNAASINVSVNNPYTFSNMRQLLNYDNSWMASYPTARSYMLGIDITF